MKERIIENLKSNFFIKLFCIPYGIWFVLSLTAMIPDETDSDPVTWGDLIITNLVLLIIWFIISYIISFVSKRTKDKHPEREKIKEEKINDETVNIIIKCFRRAKFSSIMCIISFLLGIFFVVMSFNDNLKVKLLIILIGYIPCLSFVIITLLITKFYKKNGIRTFLKVISGIFTFFLLIYYCVAIFMCALFEAINPITDLNKYSSIIKYERLLKVFPEKIPADVEKVKFYYAPGFLQGGTNYSLYYIDKNMTKEKMEKKYKEKAIWVGKKEEYTEKRGLLAGAFSYTPADYKNESDYIIYLIDGRCDDSGYCNHGDFLLIAYNEKTQEIIYRSEQW